MSEVALATKLQTQKAMPKRVLIIGLLFMLFGVLSILSIIESAVKGGINLNFAVLLLPVGIGLLRGKSSSRFWAKFWIILGYIGLALMIGLVLVQPGNAKASWFGSEIHGGRAVPYVVLIGGLFGIGLVVCHRLISSPKASAYLSNE